MNNPRHGLMLIVALLSGFTLFPSQAMTEGEREDKKIEVPNTEPVMLTINQANGTVTECEIGIANNKDGTIITLMVEQKVIAQYSSVAYKIMATNPEKLEPHIIVFIDKKTVEEHKKNDETLINTDLYITNNLMLDQLKKDFTIDPIDSIVMKEIAPPKKPAPPKKAPRKKKQRPTSGSNIFA